MLSLQLQMERLGRHVSLTSCISHQPGLTRVSPVQFAPSGSIYAGAQPGGPTAAGAGGGGCQAGTSRRRAGCLKRRRAVQGGEPGWGKAGAEHAAKAANCLSQAGLVKQQPAFCSWRGSCRVHMSGSTSCKGTMGPSSVVTAGCTCLQQHLPNRAWTGCLFCLGSHRQSGSTEGLLHLAKLQRFQKYLLPGL